METTIQDVRYGFRMLRKTPGMVAVAVLSLALGIGASTALFSVTDAVLLRTLPVPEPDELVLFRWAAGDDRAVRAVWGWITRDEAGRATSTSFSHPAFEAFRDSGESLSLVFAFFPLGRVNVGVGGRAELVEGQLVSGGYFNGLGVAAALGRTLGPADDRPAAEPAAVISHGFWRRRFGGDPDAVGRTITVNAQPYTVVGVTPPEFRGTLQVGSSPDVTVPLIHQPRLMSRGDFLADPELWWLQIMGRLREGVGTDEARAELDVVLRRVVVSTLMVEPAGGAGTAEAERTGIPELALDPGGQGLRELRERLEEPIAAMTAVVGLVLLIACANVANLLLARAGARRREIALRRSLGADRRRLIRQLLTESLLLSSMGGVLGLLCASWGRDLLVGVLATGPDSALALSTSLDLRVLTFTLAVSTLTGILFGLAPAFHSVGGDLAGALKGSPTAGAPTAGSRRPFGLRLGKGLVVAQVALSIVLLVTAGLFVRTLQNLRDVELAFEPEGLLLFKVDPTLNGYETSRIVGLYDRIRDEIEAVPAVRSVSISRFSPVSGYVSTRGVSVPGRTADPDEPSYLYAHRVGPTYLEAMGIPLLLGRDLGPDDVEGAPPVALVDQTFADLYFSGETPVGRRFRLTDADGETAVEIVGVVPSVRHQGLRADPLPMALLPYAQDAESLRSGFMTVAVRVDGDPYGVVPAIRETVRRIDDNLPIFDVRAMSDQIGESLQRERQLARLSGLCGLVALALACIGLFGVLSNAVVRRTREFGIRMALGARQGRIVLLVMRELRHVLIGVALGLPVAVGVGHWLSSMLFGLRPADPATLAVTTASLLLVAMAAAWIPARRASRVDPMVALRAE